MTRPNIGMDYAVLDCPDPAALANFYVQVLEWKSVRDEDDWHVIEGPGGGGSHFSSLRILFRWTGRPPVSGSIWICSWILLNPPRLG